MQNTAVDSRRNGQEIQLSNLKKIEEGKYIVDNAISEWQDKNSLESEGILAVGSMMACVDSREERIQDRHLCAQCHIAI